jgi:hypothetical protein
MDNSFESKEELHLSDKDIFLKIWTSPRLVFKYINDKQYGNYTTMLLIFAGIYNSLDKAISQHMGNHMPLWGVLGMSIVGGALFGWLSYYIYAALISWSGDWLKGKGDTDSILRIMSYALIPSLVSLAFLIPEIALYGNDLFNSDVQPFFFGWIDDKLILFLEAISVCLGTWSLILFVIGIAEVQKLSIWKSILNMALPILFIGIPIFIIVFLFKLIQPV